MSTQATGARRLLAGAVVHAALYPLGRDASPYQGVFLLMSRGPMRERPTCDC